MIEQLIILFTGVPAVFLSQSIWPEQRRWACVFGMVGQPAWFYYAWGDWPVVGIAALYAVSWGRGLWAHWIQPWRAAARGAG